MRVLAVLTALLAVLFAVYGVATASGTFTDDDGNTHEANIEVIAAANITKGCNPAEGNTKYCPDDIVTRGQMASFLARLLGLPSTTVDFFVDDNGSVHEADINKVAAAGITKGCNPSEGNTKYCPNDPVRRDAMGSFLSRALGLTGTGPDVFTDVAGNTHEAAINRIAAVGITKGCNPSEGNTKYCPNDPVRRDTMASFLARAIDYLAASVPTTTTTSTTTTTLAPTPEPPNGVDDAYDTHANTTLRVSPGGSADPGVVVVGSVLDNDSDPNGDSLEATVNTGPTSGQVSLSLDGSFVYTPNAGFSGDDTFTYTVSDGTGTADDTATVTITVGTDVVWYVDNTSAATADDLLGTLANPFDTMGGAETASGPGETIFIFEGNGSAYTFGAGFTADNDQPILGEAAGLTIGSDTVVPVGSPPQLAGQLTTAEDTTLAGFDITSLVTAIDASANSGTLTIDDVDASTTAAVPNEYALEIGGTGTVNVDADSALSGTVAALRTDDDVAVSIAAPVNGGFFADGFDNTLVLSGTGTLPTTDIVDSDGDLTFGPNMTVRSLRVDGSDGDESAADVTVNGPLGVTAPSGALETSWHTGTITINGPTDTTGSTATTCFYGIRAHGTYVFAGGGTITGCSLGVSVVLSNGSFAWSGTWTISGTDTAYEIRTLFLNDVTDTHTIPASVTINGGSSNALLVQREHGNISVAATINGAAGSQAIQVQDSNGPITISGPVNGTGTNVAVEVFRSSNFTLSGGGTLAGDTSTALYFNQLSGSGAISGAWNVSGASTALGVTGDFAPATLTIGAAVTLSSATLSELDLSSSTNVIMNGAIEDTAATEPGIDLAGHSGDFTMNGTLTISDADANNDVPAVDGAGSGTFLFSQPLNVESISVSGANVTLQDDVTASGGVSVTSTSTSSVDGVTAGLLSLQGVGSVTLTDPTNITLTGVNGGVLRLLDVTFPAPVTFDDLTLDTTTSAFSVWIQDVTGSVTVDDVTYNDAVTLGGDIRVENSPGVTLSNTTVPRGDLIVLNSSIAVTDSAFDEVDVTLNVAGAVVSLTSVTADDPGPGFDLNVSADSTITIDDATWNESAAFGPGLDADYSAGTSTLTVTDSTFDAGPGNDSIDITTTGNADLDVVFTDNFARAFNNMSTITFEFFVNDTSTACLDASGNDIDGWPSGLGTMDLDIFDSASLGVTQATLVDFQADNDAATAFDGSVTFSCSI